MFFIVLYFLDFFTDLAYVSQSDLKAKWETDKLMLENSKSEAEKKFTEINEQVLQIQENFHCLYFSWLINR